MTSRASDEQLWSWVDAGSPELQRYLAEHPEDRERVESLRGAIGGVRDATTRRLPERIGAYRVTGFLGEGGVGVVYEAEQSSPRRRVAVKVLRGPFADDVKRAVLLRREAEALARLRHPGIATVFEAGTTEAGDPFLVMEFVPGAPLDRHVRDRALPRRARVEIVRRVAQAVQHAHEAGVVHRDLKPSNILVDDAGNPRVLDFGLARIASLEGSLATRDSAVGTIVGTLPYMSPEQVRGLGASVDARTDVYALGVILYELLAERRPYDIDATSIPAAIRAICEEPPKPLRVAGPAVERDLATIALKALEKEPARRYASAGEMAGDLERFLENRPIVARRPSLGHRVALFVRRRRAAVAVAAVVTAAAAAVAFTSAGSNLTAQLTGDGYETRAPFDDVRWVGDSPRVPVDGRWLELESIDGLRVPLIVELCKQTSGPIGWRKRFTEDLVQVLDRMGHAPGETVELRLRDPDTNARTVRPTEPMTEPRRKTAWRARHRLPFAQARWNGDRLEISHDGRWWTLDAVADADFESLVAPIRSANAEGWQDALFPRFVDAMTDALGRTPPSEVALRLVDPATGAVATVQADLSSENYRAWWRTISAEERAR